MSLAALTFSVEPSRVVILGQSPEGIVHGAYEIPRLNTFEGGLVLRRGYIAAERENRGFGSQLFAGVTRVLEQVAFELDRPLDHFPETSFRHTTNFFLKRGYVVVKEVDSLPTATYYLKKEILPRNHELTPNERAIVAAIRRIPLLEQTDLADPSYHTQWQTI